MAELHVILLIAIVGYPFFIVPSQYIGEQNTTRTAAQMLNEIVQSGQVDRYSRTAMSPMTPPTTTKNVNGKWERNTFLWYIYTHIQFKLTWLGLA